MHFQLQLEKKTGVNIGQTTLRDFIVSIYAYNVKKLLVGNKFCL